jgi:phospholipid transport system substrate-binding protein
MGTPAKPRRRKPMKHATVIVMLNGMWLTVGLTYAQAPTQSAPQHQGAAAAADEGPTEVVQEAAYGMLGELDRDRAAYRRDPAKVGQLVEKYLVPHFDTEGAARAVLGVHWRSATPEQRKRFIDAFHQSLLTNYGSAITAFTADRLMVLPARVDPDATFATVRTVVKRDNGARVEVNYYLHKTPRGWKAQDVTIDHISYVNSYRTDFGEQIEGHGIDSVIKRLESGEKPRAIGDD